MKNIVRFITAAALALSMVAATSTPSDAWVRHHWWGWHRPVVMGLRVPVYGYPYHRGWWWHPHPWAGWRRHF